MLCMSAVILGAGCGKAENTDRIIEDTDPGVLTDVSTDVSTDIPSVPEQEIEQTKTPANKAEGVDVDLTVLSSTMVYSEVYNMMFYPDDYVGKTVKMRGMYTVFTDEGTDKVYHACVISDATACCSQGMEFELSDEYKYPEDYPEEGQEICVTGTFDTYYEGENLYCTLKNSGYVVPAARL